MWTYCQGDEHTLLGRYFEAGGASISLEMHLGGEEKGGRGPIHKHEKEGASFDFFFPSWEVASQCHSL